MADINVRDRIKMLMAQKNMNMSELAAKCDMSMPKMSKILSGDQKISIDDLVVIGYALGTNPALLISPNMSDVEDPHKEIKPLSSILRLSAPYRGDEEKYYDLLENELIHTISQYLGLKDSGKSINAHVRRLRKAKADESGMVTVPRVLITDKREGQLFANQLTIGYWFPENTEYVYLAIHYMKRGASAAQASPVAIRDMREYFSIFTPTGRGFDGEERMDLGSDSGELRTLNIGTIFCKKYRTDCPYHEEKLKKDLRDVYEAYLKLLDEATKRVQETYENMYQRRRETERLERSGQADETFGRTDLDRIMPVDNSPKGRYSRRVRAKNMAFAREDYKCELDGTHGSFIDRATGKSYMEGHMLIPFGAQSDFKESLDIEANICCLCPVCNAKIERASDTERQEMLMELYMKHKDKLKEEGIEITPMQLFKYYGMS